MSKFCQNCGMAANDGDKFCPKCGTKLYDLQELAVIQEQAQQDVANVQIAPQYIQYEEPYVPDVGIRQLFFRMDNRINRKRFFMRVMLLQILMVPFSLLTMCLPKNLAIVSGLCIFAFLIPIGMLCVRRCHDLGRSGWFMLKTAVPILGLMFCLHYLFADRDEYDSPFLNSTFFVLMIGMPFVGMLIWIYLMFASGTKGPNEYGADPLGNQADVELPKNKALRFLYQMEAPGEMRGILGVLAALVIMTVFPGMIASVFSDGKNVAAVSQQIPSQTASTSQPRAADNVSANKPKADVPIQKPVPPQPAYPPKAKEVTTKPQDKTENALANKPQENVNNGANPAQRAAIDVLYQFHSYITHKELRQAYNCMSPKMKKKISYDGWAPGFKTTVSSSVSDVKVAFENQNCIVLTYYLQSVDNPGGTKNYTGTAALVKSGKEWKLEEITNKVK